MSIWSRKCYQCLRCGATLCFHEESQTKVNGKHEIVSVDSKGNGAAYDLGQMKNKYDRVEWSETPLHNCQVDILNVAVQRYPGRVQNRYRIGLYQDGSYSCECGESFFSKVRPQIKDSF
jgi:hypothetical protein